MQQEKVGVPVNRSEGGKDCIWPDLFGTSKVPVTLLACEGIALDLAADCAGLGDEMTGINHTCCWPRTSANALVA